MTYRVGLICFGGEMQFVDINMEGSLLIADSVH